MFSMKLVKQNFLDKLNRPIEFLDNLFLNKVVPLNYQRSLQVTKKSIKIEGYLYKKTRMERILLIHN